MRTGRNISRGPVRSGTNDLSEGYLWRPEVFPVPIWDRRPRALNSAPKSRVPRCQNFGQQNLDISAIKNYLEVSKTRLVKYRVNIFLY